MNEVILTIQDNSALTNQVYRMTLTGPVSQMHPGQFINIRLQDCFLRRPISVYDSEPGKVTIVYKRIGKGTEQMSHLTAGTSLNVLTGLGNGYDLSKAGDLPLLIGGGVGIPPLFLLAKTLRNMGKPVTAVLGFNTRSEIFAENAFKSLGCHVTVTTADGSAGKRGFVTDALPDAYSYFYTCGPMPMLKAVNTATATSGQFSFEERMGCGFGACMGCSCRTKDGTKRICREGPVFEKEAILWEE